VAVAGESSIRQALSDDGAFRELHLVRTKKGTERTRFPIGCVPLPQSTTPNLLLHDREGLAGGDGAHRNAAGGARIEADHAVFGGAKIAYAGKVVANRRSRRDKCRGARTDRK
jgi:hypothetical protein